MRGSSMLVMTVKIDSNGMNTRQNKQVLSNTSAAPHESTRGLPVFHFTGIMAGKHACKAGAGISCAGTAKKMDQQDPRRAQGALSLSFWPFSMRSGFWILFQLARSPGFSLCLRAMPPSVSPGATVYSPAPAAPAVPGIPEDCSPSAGCCVPAAPGEAPDMPESPDVPVAPEDSEVPEEPAVVVGPDALVAVVGPEAPAAPVAPDESPAPEDSAPPDTAAAPVPPALSRDLGAAEPPLSTGAAAAPDAPEVASEEGVKPGDPDAPEESDDPDDCAAPEDSEAPVDPDGLVCPDAPMGPDDPPDAAAPVDSDAPEEPDEGWVVGVAGTVVVGGSPVAAPGWTVVAVVSDGAIVTVGIAAVVEVSAIVVAVSRVAEGVVAASSFLPHATAASATPIKIRRFIRLILSLRIGDAPARS